MAREDDERRLAEDGRRRVEEDRRRALAREEDDHRRAFGAGRGRPTHSPTRRRDCNRSRSKLIRDAEREDEDRLERERQRTAEIYASALASRRELAEYGEFE